MNNSSLFPTDETSVWNLQVTKQVLCIPEDQLNILRAIPGWNEVQSHCNTLRIEKDFPIETSQFQSSVYNSQNSRPVTQHNLDLFEKHQEERKNILEKKYQNYSGKLSRSVSLFYLDNTEETLLPDCSLYRVSSLPNLCESSEISVKNKELAIYSETKLSSVISKKELPVSKQVEYPAILKAKEIVSEPAKSVELFCSGKVGTEVMEVETHLPINISTHVLKPATSEVVSEKNSSPVLANEVCPNNLKSDPIKVIQLAVDIEKITQDKSTKLPEGNDFSLAQGTLIDQNKPNSEPSTLVSQVSSNISPVTEVAPEVSSDVPVNQMVSTAQKLLVDAQCIMDNLDENTKNDSSVKNTSEIPKVPTIPAVSESKNSDLHAVGEKLPVVDSETGTKADHNSFNHELQSAIKKPVESIEIPEAKKANTIGSVVTNKTQIDSLSKIKDGKNSALEEFKNSDKEVATKIEISGKRKLDSKNRRSKKLKSEDTKRGKTRSLKKVGEVYYDVEEIKTMLEIMKQFF